MTAKAKKKDTSTSGTVVYCGPTIPGVAKQFTIYNNGIPRTLAEEIVKTPRDPADKPLEPQVMESVRVDTFGQVYPFEQI